MAADTADERGGYLSFARLTLAELLGCVSGLVLAASLLLPWFGTSMNPHSRLAGARLGGTATAFDVFSILQWLLLAAAVSPYVLTWIVMRGHKLDWRPGEVTMVVGVVAFTLVLCNGIILGRPAGPDGESIEISLQVGYFVALVAAFALAVSGYQRQARHSTARKPPGVL